MSRQGSSKAENLEKPALLEYTPALHARLGPQCGILLPVFRALVFGLALCFGESINLT